MHNITTLRPGEHFMFKGFEWVCLDPHHPDGGVLAIMAKPWAEDVKFCPSGKFVDEKGNENNYRTSNVRGVLSDMAIAVFKRKGLLSHTVDLVADNGDRAYGTVRDEVFILTCNEYRKYRDFIPHYDSWIWTATPWYCGDKDSDAGCARYVRGVDTEGRLGSNGAYHAGAVAPACILNPAALNLRQSIAIVEERKEKENVNQQKEPHCGEFDAVGVSDIDIMPTIDPESLRPTAHWIDRGYVCGEHEYECSACHETEWRTSASRMKYCMFCGARMQGCKDGERK